jgi:UDP-N-acetylmuramoylalanine--D-glutamate ligase
MLAIRDIEVMNHTEDWSGKKVLVIGIARQGIALARYLSQHGAQVVVNDRRPLKQLAEAQEALADEQIQWVCGGHPIAILEDIDLLCISGGVPSDLSIVLEAANCGIPISNDSQIFLEKCPCKVIGITGSAGKTTTTTLVGLIAQAAVDELNSDANTTRVNNSSPISIKNDSNVWVGGNIGSPLISVIQEIKSTDLAVMELSSFQLEIMHRSPEVAAILNITPNHLDRHRTMKNYIAAKARIIGYQDSQDVAILNHDDPVVWNLVEDVNGQLVVFSNRKSATDFKCAYFDLESQTVRVKSNSSSDGIETNVVDIKDIPLRGKHNLMNVIAACAIALACGFPTSAMETGVKNFTGIPHRLEFIRSYGGGDWYNDSIATAPERAIAAINSFTEPLILLAGGRDKDLPWDGFASSISQRVKHLILFGEAVGVISAALTKYEGNTDITVTVCSGLKEAVSVAATKVSSGDVVLLSPGGTSFDEFNDFEERGEVFKKWVMELV